VPVVKLELGFGQALWSGTENNLKRGAVKSDKYSSREEWLFFSARVTKIVLWFASVESKPNLEFARGRTRLERGEFDSEGIGEIALKLEN
jgi:hypothetical protein